MSERRLLYRVILKTLTALGVMVLLWVFINSLFIRHQSKQKKSETIKIDLHGMIKGEIRKTAWQGQQMAVLYRAKVLTKNQNIDSSESHSKVLDPLHRSIKPSYFVFVNRGDSTNCPLFYRAGTFKDICTGNLFDNNGRVLESATQTAKRQQHNFKIAVPPHYFSESSVVFGTWKINK